MESEKVIGIDLGTTYSVVSVFENGSVTVITNSYGTRTMPSVITFTDDEILKGHSAKDSLSGTKIYDSKRLIGRTFNDPTIHQSMSNWPFKVVNVDGKPRFEVFRKGVKTLYSPEEISSMILSELKKDAETYLGKKVTKAIITVPSYFDDAQRTSTKDAARLAGLEVLRLINEPTAAALCYGLDKKGSGERNVLVFDFGGGTLDTSLLCLDDGVFEVKSTSGDTHLGGQDLDNKLVDYMIEDFTRKTKIQLRQKISENPQSGRRMLDKLKKSAEKTKIILSASLQTPIMIESLCDGVDYNGSITRSRFEELCAPLFSRCMNCVENTLRDAKLSKNQIDEIVLVGGSSRCPKIQEMLTNYFNGKQLCRSVNPDEAIAYGAAIQGSVLSNDDSAPKELLLLDVCPLSLGVMEGMMRKMHVIIPRNTTIPCTKKQSFTTGSSNQSQAEIVVFEGENARADANKKLGQFSLENLGSSTEKVGNHARIEISFDVDANGILSVSAKSGSIEKKIQIKNETKLSESEIQEMLRRAEQNKKEDEEFTRKVEKANEIQMFISQLPESEQDAYRFRINPSVSLQELDNILTEVREKIASGAGSNSAQEVPMDSSFIPPSSGPTVTEVD